MGFIDLVLNLAGLLLWVNWRSEQLDATLRVPVISLAHTLRKANTSPIQRWKFPIGLAALLIVRACLYRHLGAAAQHTFTLDLAAVALPFRCDDIRLMLVYSLASFGFVLVFFYLALLFLSLVNARLPDTDPNHRFVRVHLGWVDRVPAFGKWLMPGVAGTMFWPATAYGWAALGILPQPHGFAELWQQGIVIGLGVYLQWRWVILAVLLLYLVNLYVYLGRLPIWGYVGSTARSLLAPLSALPLRAGKVDFAPIVAMALICVVAQGLIAGWRTSWGDVPALLPWLYTHVPF